MADELWIGRGEVTPLPGADAEIADATWAMATVIVFAASEEECRERLEEALAASHLGLVKFDSAAPAHEWLDVDEDFFASVLEAAQSREPVLFVLNTDEPADAIDADTAALQAAAGSETAVQFRLIGSDDWMHGFVVGASEDWALLHVVDLGAVMLDGYRAVRLDEVVDVEELEAERHFVLRVLEDRSVRPLDPGIPLSDTRSILEALAARYPLVALGEVRRPDGVMVGKIADVDAEHVMLAGVSTVGDATAEAVHAYNDIRLIGFGTAYLDALASLVP